jgi:hypothetical protein
MQRAMAHHATYADWLPEISEPMFRQLVREGFYRGLVRSVFWILLLVLFWSVVPARDEMVRSLQIVFWPTFILAAAVWGWKQFAGQCVEREFLYRRLHGKWRWER